MTALKFLDLSYNQLNILPDKIFQGLTALKELMFSHNHLNILPEHLFQKLTALQQLYLDNNHLSSLPETIFQGLTALTRLYLDNNHLNSLPQHLLQGLVSLEWFTLLQNQFITIPEALIGINPDDYDLRQNFQLTADGKCHVLENQAPPSHQDIFDQLIRSMWDNSLLHYALRNEAPWGVHFTEVQREKLEVKREEIAERNKTTLLPLCQLFELYQQKRSCEYKLIGKIQQFVYPKLK